MATNYGVSSRFYIDGLQFKKSSWFKTSPVQGFNVSVLVVKHSADTSGIESVNAPFAEFAFNRITPPDYGSNSCIARYTGIPINKPDFVADYHFISLARMIDYLMQRNCGNYQGKITGGYDTPGATK